MATTNVPTTPSQILPPTTGDNGTSLIARAEALNAFMKMQPAADQARHNATTIQQQQHQQQYQNKKNTISPRAKSNNHQSSSTPTSPYSSRSPNGPSSPANNSSNKGCFCFGNGGNEGGIGHNHNMYGSNGTHAATSSISTADIQRHQQRPKREYYPDNLSVQPKPHEWTNEMEWLIISCVEFLEGHGLHERNLFAVSAVDDLVRSMTVPLGQPLSTSTDPHVAAGVIKAKIRHATDPLISKQCLRDYIDSHANKEEENKKNKDNNNKTTNNNNVKPQSNFQTSFLLRTINDMSKYKNQRRAFILARFMRLLGRVSANVEHSKMNAHCLAKCVAPSMLHWDPNSNFALLMLGKITAYVMDMIEDARVFDEQLCIKIEQLEKEGGWK